MNGQARFAGNGLYESTDLIKTMAAVVQSIEEGSLFHCMQEPMVRKDGRTD